MVIAAEGVAPQKHSGRLHVMDPRSLWNTCLTRVCSRHRQAVFVCADPVTQPSSMAAAEQLTRVSQAAGTGPTASETAGAPSGSSTGKAAGRNPVSDSDETYLWLDMSQCALTARMC